MFVKNIKIFFELADKIFDSSTIGECVKSLTLPPGYVRYIVGDLAWNIAPTLGILKTGMSNPLVWLHMEREGDRFCHRLLN